MKNGRIQIQTANMEKTTNRAKMVHKSKIAALKAQVLKLVKRYHEPPVLLYFSDFPG